MKSNTMLLPRVRLSGGGDYEPAQVFTDHMVAALQSGHTTRLFMAGGMELKVDMTLEKFMLRYKLDNPEV
jgi:hypothetical protein